MKIQKNKFFGGGGGFGSGDSGWGVRVNVTRGWVERGGVRVNVSEK